MNKRSITFLLITFLAGAPFGALRAEGENSVKNRIRIVKHSELQRSRPDDSDEYNAEKMEMLASRRRSLILDIKRFIREARDSDQKAELNLRLGNLYMEDYRGTLAKAQQQFEQNSAAYKADKSGHKAPRFDSSEAMNSLAKAKVIYKDLLQRYPKHPRRDEMLFFLAQASLDTGKIDEGMSFFKRLSDESPNSKYISDALVALGDYYFESNKFPQAEIYYDKLIAKRYRPLVPYALYKKGWCAYNLQHVDVALKNWKWIIQNEDAEENGAPVRIKNEALRDIPLAFVDLNMMNDGIAFFKSFGDPIYRNGLDTMAGRYYEKGDYRAAIALYEALVAIDPNFRKNPAYDINIVEGLKLKGDPNGAVARLFSRLPNYMKDSSWYEINAANPAVVQEAARNFEETARKYAFQFHAEGQKTKNESLYNVAKQLYTKYLEYFPRTPQTAQVRFYLAEILYKQNQYVAASDQYYLVYKDQAAGNLRLDSIRYALSSLDRQLNLDRQKAGLTAISSKTTAKIKAKEDASLEVQPYSDVESKFINIANEYLGAFPNAKDAPDVLYEQAYLHYMHFELGPAYKSFWQLVQKYPAHSTAFSSAYLILDILNRKKDFPKLIAACQRFLQNPSFTKAEFRKEVSDILRHAELKRIQLAEEKGNYKEAADGYVEYTKAYGHADDALFEKALYNASVNYTKAGYYMLAVETQEKFLRRFPKSQLRENMLLQVAKTYETLTSFEKAAKYYELFASDYSRNTQAKSALRLAGLYYWGSGNQGKGESVMLTYLRLYPRDNKVVEKDLINMYESQNSMDKEIGYLMRARAERGISFPDYVGYSVRIAELVGQKTGHMPVKPMEEALKIAQRYPREMSSSPKGVEAMSKLLFWFVKRREDYYYSLKLAGPQRQIEINLQKKLALMKELEKDFSHVTSLGSGEWGLASIYKTAAIYHNMAQEVAHAPVPGELSAEQIDQYRSEIQKQMVKPFNEKALAMVAQCLDKAQEFNLLSNWTPKCYSLAAELQPTRYPMVRTFYLPPLQTAVLIPGKADSKISLGNVKSYAYPFFSSALFSPAPDRSTASVGAMDNVLLYDGKPSFSDMPGAVPSEISYRVLSEERKQVLKNSYESERPSDNRKASSFAFLNVLRLTSPQSAVPRIQEAILRDPNNIALNNLLGLTYMELGNLPAAKITWLSLVARGIKNAAVWDNLGVLTHMEGKETAAIDYFQEATLLEAPREAQVNLGFIALKYRNGFEAKKHFEKALELAKDDVAAQVGLAVAQLQNREMDNAKDGLVDLSKKYKSDPYARLSLGYFLLDVEKESDLAKRVLSDYMESQGSGEGDIQFRQALQEAKRGVAAPSDGLPSIGQ